MTNLNLENKLAKALAFRKHYYESYCKAHEFEVGSDLAKQEWLECKRWHILFHSLDTNEIEELLDLYCNGGKS